MLSLEKYQEIKDAHFLKFITEFLHCDDPQIYRKNLHALRKPFSMYDGIIYKDPEVKKYKRYSINNSMTKEEIKKIVADIKEQRIQKKNQEKKVHDLRYEKAREYMKKIRQNILTNHGILEKPQPNIKNASAPIKNASYSIQTEPAKTPLVTWEFLQNLSVSKNKKLSQSFIDIDPKLFPKEIVDEYKSSAEEEEILKKLLNRPQKYTAQINKRERISMDFEENLKKNPVSLSVQISPRGFL